MKIIFFGTPDYVTPILDALHKEHEIVSVVTKEPKETGRDKKLEYSAVDTWAFKKKIVRHFDFNDLEDADLGVCASYGKIIPKQTIEHFKYGILNIHPSLLPKYKGPSPIQTTLANGDTQTGVTIIKMDEKMDHGPIVVQFKEDVLETDNFESLRTRLFERSAQVLVETIDPYIKQKIKPKEQDTTGESFTKIITREDGYFKYPDQLDRNTFNKFRAFSPWPGIWTKITTNTKKIVEEKRLKVVSCHMEEEVLVLDIVQVEGKNPVTFKQFLISYLKQI